MSKQMKNKKRKAILLVAILGIFGAFMDLFVFPRLHSFLSNTPKIENAEILVVQGWIFDTMINQAFVEFSKNNYKAIVITGNSARVATSNQKLKNLGIKEDKIIRAPYPNTIAKNFTFHEAFSLRDTLMQCFPEISSINIATSQVHGKKTRTIFKKVLSKNIKVGIVACKPNHYDVDHIWRSPHGINLSIRFFVGYLYALLWKPAWVKGS